MVADELHRVGVGEDRQQVPWLPASCYQRRRDSRIGSWWRNQLVVLAGSRLAVTSHGPEILKSVHR
jgi:hypothetical protein